MTNEEIRWVQDVANRVYHDGRVYTACEVFLLADKISTLQMTLGDLIKTNMRLMKGDIESELTDSLLKLRDDLQYKIEQTKEEARSYAWYLVFDVYKKTHQEEHAQLDLRFKEWAGFAGHLGLKIKRLSDELDQRMKNVAGLFADLDARARELEQGVQTMVQQTLQGLAPDTENNSDITPQLKKPGRPRKQKTSGSVKQCI
jgi:hypothetical protein